MGNQQVFSLSIDYRTYSMR